MVKIGLLNANSENNHERSDAPSNHHPSQKPSGFQRSLVAIWLPSWLVYVLGIIGAIYLLNPQPAWSIDSDITPIIGNLDEGLAMVWSWLEFGSQSRSKTVSQKAIWLHRRSAIPNLEI